VPDSDNPGQGDDREREIAELWQQILRQELQHRRTWRGLFEQHEKVTGMKVRQLRVERGWTQADLGRKLDGLGWPLDQTTISNLELGRRPIRIAEAAALALAFGIPMAALLYLPVRGEPWSMAEMRTRLQEIDNRIAELERTMQAFATQHADYQFERLRLVQAMNEAAKAGERGEIEDLNLSAEETEGLIEGMTPEGRERIAEAMEPEQRAKVRNEQLEAMKDGEVERLADESFRMYQAGASLEQVSQFLAEAMPPGIADATRTAAEIVGGTLGVSGLTAGVSGLRGFTEAEIMPPGMAEATRAIAEIFGRTLRESGGLSGSAQADAGTSKRGGS
jgi:transcriptional regulator with XRE-family HTH domain